VYAHIDQLQDGVYTHETVIHDANFVNPDNPDIHTQNIKNMWMRVYLLVIRTITNLYSTSTPTIFLRFASIVSGRNKVVMVSN
jgi:hypothetical protein